MFRSVGLPPGLRLEFAQCNLQGGGVAPALEVEINSLCLSSKVFAKDDYG